MQLLLVFQLNFAGNLIKLAISKLFSKNVLTNSQKWNILTTSKTARALWAEAYSVLFCFYKAKIRPLKFIFKMDRRELKWQKFPKFLAAWYLMIRRCRKDFQSQLTRLWKRQSRTVWLARCSTRLRQLPIIFYSSNRCPHLCPTILYSCRTRRIRNMLSRNDNI